MLIFVLNSNYKDLDHKFSDAYFLSFQEFLLIMMFCFGHLDQRNLEYFLC